MWGINLYVGSTAAPLTKCEIKYVSALPEPRINSRRLTAMEQFAKLTKIKTRDRKKNNG